MGTSHGSVQSDCKVLISIDSNRFFIKQSNLLQIQLSGFAFDNNKIDHEAYHNPLLHPYLLIQLSNTNNLPKHGEDLEPQLVSANSTSQILFEPSTTDATLYKVSTVSSDGSQSTRDHGSINICESRLTTNMKSDNEEDQSRGDTYDGRA